MTPAFSSTRQALAFGLLVAALIALPAFAACTGWFKIDGRYPYIWEKFDAYPTIEQHVFRETNTVDVALVGSSRIYAALNALSVQEEFSQHLHREAEVFTLGWSGAGFDFLYFIARDLLIHRPVKMLVVYDETQRVRKSPGNQDLVFRTHSLPDRRAPIWYWRGQDLAALRLLQLPLNRFLAWYGTAVIDFPRHLLDMIRPNEGFILSQRPYMQRLIANHGSLRQDQGWGESTDTLQSYNPAEFPATSADTVIYSAATRALFTFNGPHFDAYESYFVRKLVDLCQQHGTQLVVLHIPLPTESQSATMPELQCWAEELKAPVQLIGIPGAKLFANRTPDEVRHLFYYNEWHLNQNGQDLFTPLITPALIKLYDE